MDNEKLAHALAIGSAEAAILRTLLAAVIARHPQRGEIVSECERSIAEQMIESARQDHYPQFREELRTQWQLFRPLFGAS